VSLWPEPLARAYAACEALARSHYENFPVASQLLPAPMRPHVAAVYAFARVADDIADEGSAPAPDRLARLNAWQRRLHAAVTTEDAEGAPHEHEDLIIAALAHSIRSLDLPIALFDDLVSAFGQDTMSRLYASWTDVFDYCRRSANPVGRLVLRIAGHRDEALDRSSDALCTALQLANFWQDVSLDLAQDRIYIPLEDMRRFDYSQGELRAGIADERFRALMRFEVARARALFAEGAALEPLVDRRARTDVRLFRLGGEAVLDAIEAADYDVLSSRPRVPKARKLWMALSNGVRMKAGL
jgi:squalene synthase HpnC